MTTQYLTMTSRMRVAITCWFRLQENGGNTIESHLYFFEEHVIIFYFFEDHVFSHCDD